MEGDGEWWRGKRGDDIIPSVSSSETDFPVGKESDTLCILNLFIHSGNVDSGMADL